MNATSTGRVSSGGATSRYRFNANRLGQLMDEQELSDADLAGRTGLDRGTVHRFRTGRLVPKMPTGAALAAAIGVPMERLIDRLVPMEPSTDDAGVEEGS